MVHACVLPVGEVRRNACYEAYEHEDGFAGGESLCHCVELCWGKLDFEIV